MVADDLSEKLQKKVSAKWQEAIIDQSEYLDPRAPFCPPDWAISIRGTDVFAFDDYNYLQGQAGNGKSFTMCVYESVILGRDFGEIKYVGNREKPKVLHVDTEQSQGNVQLHVRRLYEMVGWEQSSDHSDQLRVLMLRETARPQDKWAKVIRACHDFRPDFLFVDGMLDVVEGMNSEEGCSMVINEAGALSSIFKLCMIGICHENPTNPKAKSDEGPAKPAGHVGSFSQRKGSAGQGTTKSLVGTDPTFSVVPKKVRNKDYNGFKFKIKDVQIRVDGRDYTIGIPYWVDSFEDTMVEKPEEKEDPRKAAIRKAMNAITWSIEGLRYKDVVKGLERQGITSGRKQSDYIVEAQSYGIIYKADDTKRYFLVDTLLAKVDTSASIGFNSMGDSDEDPFK